MSENKKTLLSREYTRRQFLKLTGKGFAGVALSSSMLSLLGCTQAQAEAGLVNVIATPDYVLVANSAKCTGCQRCEMNCTLANDGDCHPYMSRIRVRDVVNYGSEIDANKAVGNGMFGDWTVQPETCKQCKDPACMNACPMLSTLRNSPAFVRSTKRSALAAALALLPARGICPVSMLKPVSPPSA